MLARDFKAELILEAFAENPFLPKSYANRERFSLGNEMTFLLDRYEDYVNRIKQFKLYDSLHISDYIFHKTLLYANVNLPDKDELNLFKRYFNLLFPNLEEPELFVYIHSTLDKLIGNIKTRGRDFEQQVNPQYLQDVEDEYFKWFAENQHLRIVIIEADDLDFVNNPADYEKIKNLVSRTFTKGIHQFNLHNE